MRSAIVLLKVGINKSGVKKFDFVHISLIVCNRTGTIICYGINSMECHSEEVALYNLNKELRHYPYNRGFCIINLAITKNYKIRISKPCKKCSEKIQKYKTARITRVVWTLEDGSMESVNFDPNQSLCNLIHAKYSSKHKQ